MTGEFVHVRDQYCLLQLPCGAANSFTIPNACASHRALKGSEHQLTSLYEIKADPKEIHCLPEGSGNVSQICYQIPFAFYKGCHLRYQDTVSLGLIPGTSASSASPRPMTTTS